ncbi:hypothetical protein [Actinacidiphila oryziradicis]|uniref:hypothetical protein n=1 Tax=Actinacidiphila oryziradicis TaxID=2571141 RepID=UPI0023F06DB5|nr:hypothetical protein [Actinacidiphila oryziradicis]MCW2870094.1 hypothetical protein [Actinacidiphila oryziradicis]
MIGGRALVAVAGVCAVLAGAAGQASADSSVPYWKPGGEAVAGSAVSTEAPPLAAGSTYRDTIKNDVTKYYAVTLDAKSSAYLSVFALPPPGTKVEFPDDMRLILDDSAGNRCDSADVRFGTDSTGRPVGSYVQRTIEPNGRCQEAGQYNLLVSRGDSAGSDQRAWPLEIRYMPEPGLKTGAAQGPVVVNDSASPAPVTGTPQKAQGGVSPDTAVGVSTGVWEDAVRPGETRFYKVPVNWGQRVFLVADFANTETTKFGVVGQGVRVEAYNPARGLVGSGSATYMGDAASVRLGTVRVSYANRTSDDAAVAMMRFAGWYYFAVSVDQDVAGFITGSVPVRLAVEVQGTAISGPGYDGDAAKAGFGVTGTTGTSGTRGTVAASGGTGGGGGSADGTVGSQTVSAATGGPDSALRAVGFTALGTGTVLVLWLVVWAIAARRRQPTDAAW